MAYSVARPLDITQDYQNVITVKAATDTLYSGSCIVAATLAGTYASKDSDVYVATKPEAITDADLAILVPDEYYEDENGNRINITDPTVMAYRAGTYLKAIRPQLNKSYFMTTDLVTTASASLIAAGNYLYPTASSYLYTATDTVDDFATAKLVYKIEEINYKTTYVGLSALTGMRVRVVKSVGL